ncbi:uncharacterized protein BROUX77_003078 [Berkeleyomyces rouxiae]|uniref:uncharacterized protein n=1 Tax=Berkeleyomyces rouxiae TaxID=2035830 RepID=UPI003B79C98E
MSDIATASSLLTSSSLKSIFEAYTPGFSSLQSFFIRWLHIDITKLAMALTICAMLSGALTNAHDMATRFYWWIARFLTASVSITGKDRLNREVINWLGAHVLRQKSSGNNASILGCQESRIMIASSSETTTQSDAFLYCRRSETDDETEKTSSSKSPTTSSVVGRRAPVHYLPTFGVAWFKFEGSTFLVRRISADKSSSRSPLVRYTQSFNSDEYQEAAAGEDPLVIMCLGRSVVPIKRFLNACRDFADEQSEKFLTVRTVRGGWHSDTWDVSVLRPRRSLNSVHLKAKEKESLLKDMATYLHPATRRFYMSHSIPYRRGYLLHGPPGTGKTSLSLALAAHFGLDLHLINLPSMREDSDLESLFTSLPPRCIVLLEDVDCVCFKRKLNLGRGAGGEHDEASGLSSSEDEDEFNMHRFGGVSLSGLLNILDGVTSQEGRIVVMTSNIPENLDEALVRPGRIDRKVYLGYLSRECAHEMFVRMYEEQLPKEVRREEEEDSFFDSTRRNTWGNDFASRFNSPSSPGSSPTGYKFQPHWTRSSLDQMATEFAQTIPDERFSPALVQGFLLEHKHSPVEALRVAEEWSAAELKRLEEAEAMKTRSIAKKMAKIKYQRQNRKLTSLENEVRLKESMKTALANREAMLKKEKREQRKKAAQTSGECISSSEDSSSSSSSSSDSDESTKKKHKKSRNRSSKKKSKSKATTRKGENEDSDHSSKTSSSSSKKVASSTPASSPEPDTQNMPEQLSSNASEVIAENQKPAESHVPDAPRAEHTAGPVPQQGVQPPVLAAQEPLNQGVEAGQESHVYSSNDKRSDQVQDDADRAQNVNQVKERLQKIDEEPELPRESPASLQEAPILGPVTPTTPVPTLPPSLPSSILDIEGSISATPPLPSPTSPSQLQPPTQMPPPRPPLLGKLPLLRRHTSSGSGAASIDSTKSPRRLSANLENMVGAALDFRSLNSGSRRGSSSGSMSSMAPAALPAADAAVRSDMTPAPTSSAEVASSPHERVQPHLHSESRIAASGAEEKVKDEKIGELTV